MPEPSDAVTVSHAADAVPEPPSGVTDRSGTSWRSRLSWWSLPVLAGVAVLLADSVHTAVRRLPVPETRGVLDPWAATVVPPRAGYAVAPWPTLLALGAVATVALTVAALGAAVLLASRSRPWWLRAVLLWAAVVVGGVVAVGAAQLGEVVHGIELFGGRGGSHVRMFTLPALAEAVRWGLLWGLGPALLTTWLASASRGATPAGGAIDVVRGRRRAWWRPLALLVAAVVAGVGLVLVARAAAVSTMTEVAQPAPTPAAGPTDPPPLVAPTSASAVAGRCAPEDLVTTFAFVDAATGRRFGVATTTSTAQEPCVVVGLPDLAFADADGESVRPAIEPWGGFDTGGIPGDDVTEPVATDVPVTLAPGQSARSELTWRGSAAGALTPEQVLVAPWPGAPRTVVDEPIDAETGAPLGVSPWRGPFTLNELAGGESS